MRHDSHYTRLGARTERQSWRLWIEETGYQRLHRNNFTPGTPFDVRPRAGSGIILEAKLLASFHVSTRRSQGLLSFENRILTSAFSAPDVRVRIHVGQLIVQPLLRAHSVVCPGTAIWRIEDLYLVTPEGRFPLRSASPLRLPQAAACIDASLTEANLVFATEIIGNHRPGKVLIRGDDVMRMIAKQFLQSAGYSEGPVPNEYLR